MPTRALNAAGALLAQFFFIAAGVYLGMRADDWKEERTRLDAERASLENFRSEMLANRAAVATHLKYNESMRDSMALSQKRGDPPPRSVNDVLHRIGFHGLSSVSYAHVAWDMALATQSLAYLPPKLAFSVGKVYAFQSRMEELQSVALSQLFAPAALEDARWQQFARSLAGHLEDMHYSEPALIKAYDTLVPRIDSTLRTLPR
jgi:hypothetical protein